MSDAHALWDVRSYLQLLRPLYTLGGQLKTLAPQVEGSGRGDIGEELSTIQCIYLPVFIKEGSIKANDGLRVALMKN